MMIYRSLYIDKYHLQSSERFRKLCDAQHFFWNLDHLRTERDALLACDALVCLAQIADGSVIAHQKCAACTLIIRIFRAFGDVGLFGAFIIV